MKHERQPPSPKLHLIEEVAAILRVSTKTVRRLIDKRELTPPAASVGRSGCIRMTSPTTSTGSAACDRDDRAGPLAAYQVNDKSILGNMSAYISTRMVIVRIPVMPLLCFRVLPCPVLSVQHVPEGEINGRHQD
jgi:excisionase family DNA binding protein